MDVGKRGDHVDRGGNRSAIVVAERPAAGVSVQAEYRGAAAARHHDEAAIGHRYGAVHDSIRACVRRSMQQERIAPRARRRCRTFGGTPRTEYAGACTRFGRRIETRPRAVRCGTRQRGIVRIGVDEQRAVDRDDSVQRMGQRRDEIVEAGGAHTFGKLGGGEGLHGRYVAARPVCSCAYCGKRDAFDRTTTLHEVYSERPATTDARSGAQAGNRFIDVPSSGAARRIGYAYVSIGKIFAAMLASVNTSFHWKYLLAKQMH
ncbi:hypothetical protein [Burkholderia sp. BCC0506]|uniref:hypothetical protein n=1 Tax=Burkholderia sp. BCC0506 TaxID=2676290 RepID=UPI0015884FCC|nr:hypothetical protein [Burkholderia sp. BCC0506]